jgi:hypothetical protein
MTRHITESVFEGTARKGYRVKYIDPATQDEKQLWDGLESPNIVYEVEDGNEAMLDTWDKKGAKALDKFKALPNGTILIVYKYEGTGVGEGKWIQVVIADKGETDAC